MKQCCTCKTEKSLDDFHRHRGSPDGRYSVCKTCRVETSKAYRDKHGDKIRAAWREAHKANPHKHRENARRYQAENWEYRKAYKRAWDKANKDKCNAKTARRAAQRAMATPQWLTPEQRKEIRWFYETARELQWLSEEPLHVDHIVPLRGKNVCGLHVPWNLRIVPASVNCSKQNRLDFDR